MEKRKVDVVIIGMSTAGLNAYNFAKKSGATCAIIDKGPLGISCTCAQAGCMPSKALISAAEARHHFDRAKEFGLENNRKAKVLGEVVMKNVRMMRDTFVGRMQERFKVLPKEVDRIMGTARFMDPHTLKVDNHTLVEGKAIVIATGSYPHIPSILKDAGNRLLTNQRVFDLPKVPESLLVVGMGPIGLELGQAFSRLGTRTVFLDLFRALGGLTDPVVLQKAIEIFKDELNLIAPAALTSVERRPDGLKVAYETDNGSVHQESVEYILAAAGRKPRVKDIDLEKTGLSLDNGGMPSYNQETGQCEDSHIFLAGDVTGEKQFLHEAFHEGEIAGDNAACFPEVRHFKRKTPLAISFTDPQIAIFGKTFKEFDNHGPAFIGAVDFTSQGRSLLMKADRGFGRLYADTKGLLAGGEIVGPRAEHLGHLLAWSIQQGNKVEKILEMPFYHPVIEEGIQGALKILQGKIHPAKGKNFNFFGGE